MEPSEKVIARIDGVAASQARMEALMLELQRDLGALAASLGEAGREQAGAAAPPGTEALSSEEAPPKEEAPPMEEALLEEEAEEEVEALGTASMRISQLHGATEDEDSEVPPSLPADWPSSVTMRWTPSQRVQQYKPRRRTFNTASEASLGSALIESHSDDHLGSVECIVIDPNSNAYALFSIASLLMLMYDLLIIPYMIAWDVDLEGALLWLAAVSCCFWTVDVAMSFVTGYSLHGRLEMRLVFVARRYVRSWLLPDLIIVTSDWMGLALAMTTSQTVAGIRMLRFAKLWKLVRLIGLVRTMKVLRRLEDVVMNLLSDTGRACLRALLIVCGTFLFNHVFGCAWYMIGRVAPSDTGMRWVDKATDWNGESIPFSASSPLHQYITSFHWSMAQFTLGAMDFISYNSVERTFNVFCLAIGLVFGSALVSILSASMVDQQMAKNAQNEILRKLRHFLQEHKISRGVAALVQQQAQERLAVQQAVQEEDVAALQLLSRDLRTTLRHETFREQLNAHGLFRLWEDTSPSTAKMLCIEAMESSALRAQDDLFHPGTSASKAHCLVSGRAIYIQQPETAPVVQSRKLPIETNVWLCEAALWSHWVHVGKARARSHCQVVSISAEPLMEVLAKHSLINMISREYGRSFHRRLVAARPPLAHWPTDLEVPFTDYSEMVASMGTNLRVRIGALGLEHTNQRRLRHLSQSCLAKLQEEVESCQCTLTVGPQGQLQRVVSVAPVWMEDAHGRVLVELGRVEAGTWQRKTACQLPAAQQQADEEPGAVYLRLLQQLGVEQEGVQVLSVTREQECREMKAYGVRTVFLRTVYRVRLAGELPLPALALAPKSTTALSPRRWRPSLMSMRTNNEATRQRASHRSSVVEEAPVRRSLSIPSDTSSPSLERRMPSLRSMGSDASLPSVLMRAPVYRTKDEDGQSVLYTWLDEETFKHYATRAGEKELDSMLAILIRQGLEDEFTI